MNNENQTSDKLYDNVEYYDQFSQTYEDRRGYGYHLLIDDLESSLIIPPAKDKDVLEVGCGTGLILKRVAEHARRAEGIDLSPGMLSVAKKRGLSVQEASATKLPFDDASFDLCYSFKVLSHVKDLATALAEMSRVTRPGGRVFIELYNRHSIRYLIRRLRGGEKINTEIDDNQVFVRFYKLEEMLQCFPEDLTVKQLHGVRLFTALPSMVTWPLAGHALKWAERRFMSSRLARFGGFLVIEAIRS